MTKSIVSNTRHGVRDNSILATYNQLIGIRLYYCITIVSAVIFRISFFNSYRGES